MSARFTLREMALTLATGIGPITEPNDFDAALDDYRAEVLREAADLLDESESLRDLTDDHMHDVNAAANELRRMADDAATGGA